jgi:hypothetical protein
MEAWADRSVKKWYESGLIHGAPSLDEKKGKVRIVTLIGEFYG